MKLKQWLYGLTALSMLAACSEKDLAPGSGSENGLSSEKGVSYLGISLELPSEPSTRGENDDFEDGLKKEYEISHAAILLFRGNTEADAKFIGAYQLGTDQAFDQPNGDQITVSFQKSIKVLEKPTLTNNEKLWGLAIVNYSTEIFDISTDENDDYGDLTVITTDGAVDLNRVSESETPTTFADFRGYITNSTFIRRNGGYFFMTNAPLNSSKGTTALPTASIETLAELQNNFEKTAVEAEQNPAGCIFVERAVAKITCSNFPSSVTIPHTTVTLSEDGAPVYTTEDYTLKVASVEWILDNEEATSYIVRNAQTAQPFWEYGYNGKYRFVGGVNMYDHQYDAAEALHTNKYRTYWCVDPAYDKNKNFNNQANAENANFAALTLGNTNYASSAALYPHENTFDVKHQNYQNTTRVVFKVRYAEDNNPNLQLFALRDQPQAFYLRADAQSLLQRSVLGSTRLHDLILKYKKDDIPTLDYKVDDFTFSWATISKENEENNEYVDSEKGINVGDYIITKITINDDFINNNFKENLTNAELTDIAAELQSVATTANQANHIVTFANNTCYYAAYIQHFGDDYCPLPAGWVGDQVDEVYKDSPEAANVNSERYLGRYGLVRNNWYELSVNPIVKLGSATVPPGNVTTSDDNKTEEWYLSARIHVLSWAKRTQSVIF